MKSRYAVPESDVERAAKNRDAPPAWARLRTAMLIAPGVAPLVFEVQLALVLAFSTWFEVHYNGAAIIVLGWVAITAGLGLSYAIGWGVGMPIAACRKERLSGKGCMGFALVTAAILAAASPLVVTNSEGWTIVSAFRLGIYIFALICIPVVSAAGAFFLIASRSGTAHNSDSEIEEA